MYNQIKKDFKIKDLKNNKIYKLNKKRYILKRNILRSVNFKKKSFTQTQTKNTFEQGKDCIKSNSKIDGLMNMCCENDNTFPVVDSETGELIGEIDRTIIMKSMTSS